MKNRLHFIAGLPRSGSTLLSAILRQNPKFHASMSSPMASLFMAMQSATSRKNEYAVFIDENQKREIFKGLFQSYYHFLKNEEVAFDTNRSWCSKLPILINLFPKSKFVCCVRDVSWILDSFERIIQKNPLELSGIFNYNPSTTVYTRIGSLAASDGIVGYALDSLREAYFGPHGENLILIDYDVLVRNPRSTLKDLYEFLDEDWYEHDFDNVAFQSEKFDSLIGTPDLHTVKGKVEWREKKSILPPHLFARFSSDAFWKDRSLNINNVRVLA